MRHAVTIPVLLLILVTGASCSGEGHKADTEYKQPDYIDDGREKHANLEYIEDFYDFGTIKHGEIVSHTFTFLNTGNIPLVVKDVIVGCGCTKPKVNKKILKPNEQATMEVVFDSRGWHGVQYKTITIQSNSITPRKSVTIKINVV